MVVEIAAGSASYDLHDKKETYRRAGVPEYIVWRIVDRLIDWFRLRDGEYVRLEPDEDGVIESEVLPGLRLPLDKMLAGDDKGVLAAIGAPVAAMCREDRVRRARRSDRRRRPQRADAPAWPTAPLPARSKTER